MKTKRFVVALLIFSLVMWCGSVSALAMNTGFSTQEMNADDEQMFLSNIDLSVVKEKPEITSMLCFDVNNNGLIAIGSRGATKQYVSVFSSDGVFMYGYTFYCSGSFGVAWDNNNIIIYFVRSDVAALFDQTGTNLELKKIEDTIDNNSYWNHSVFSTRRNSENCEYILQNNFGLLNVFSTSYSQLVKIDPQGAKTTVVDVSQTGKTKAVVFLIITLAFIVMVALIIKRQLLKGKRFR